MVTGPGVQVIIGHLAEGLPFLLPRLEHRLAKQEDGIGLGSATSTVSEYFSDNFYATTSGHVHARTLFNTIGELGVDRVLFSADCPYETMGEAAAWRDNSLLCRNDAQKIGRDNARRLFRRLGQQPHEPAMSPGLPPPARHPASRRRAEPGSRGRARTERVVRV